MVTKADLLLSLAWESAAPAGRVRHRDHFFAETVDIARDVLPVPLKEGLAKAVAGETVSVSATVADLLGELEGAVMEVPMAAFQGRYADGTAVAPKFGRFYPAPLFNGVPCNKGGTIRCVGLEGNRLTLDTRHPLASYRLQLSATVIGSLDTEAFPARQAVNWNAQLANGPGLQACWQGRETDFLDNGAYARPDEGADPDFYAPPRITAHLDEKAQQIVGKFYQTIIPAEGRILDLMSSVHSNLARDQRYGALIGLGLNTQEMKANERLDNAVVSDLNTGQFMPFGASCFDAAVCTVSIDYLIDPVHTIGEVARVLRPGAPFAVTFSNRWFPPKVTRLWTELDSFEQMALVVRYLEQSGAFGDIETISFRGYPRPMSDPNYRYVTKADPIFAVVGRKRGD